MNADPDPVDGPKPRRTSLREVMHLYLYLLEKKDIDSWIELWAEDGVLEMPFSPPPLPRRIDGRGAILEHFRGTPAFFSRINYKGLIVRPLAERRSGFVEFQGDLEVASTGRPYRSAYAAYVMLDEQGKISLLREYVDPRELSGATAPDREAWAREFLGVVDRGDPDRIAERLTDDVRLVFGNDEPLTGRAAVRGAFAASRESLAGVRHEIRGVTVGEDGDAPVVSVEAIAHYKLPAGEVVALPVTSTFRLGADERVRDYRIYMDRAPLKDALAGPSR